MSRLQPMPQIQLPAADLRPFGEQWKENGETLRRGGPHSSIQLGNVIDTAVAKSMAHMLGGLPIKKPKRTDLLPPHENCVENGPSRVVGGVRPQNFDVCYRPDGVRFVFDSKTLNSTKSVGKNYQNMINDLGTESTTVHTRFPIAVTAYIVVIPSPCLESPQKEAMTETLERMHQRGSPTDLAHKAEAISLLLWKPGSGRVDPNWPPQDSPIRVEKFSKYVEEAYRERYKGLDPHT